METTIAIVAIIMAVAGCSISILHYIKSSSCCGANLITANTDEKPHFTPVSTDITNEITTLTTSIK